jgi:cyclopropane-fatty-acyl-phospholipid synthase
MLLEAFSARSRARIEPLLEDLRCGSVVLHRTGAVPARFGTALPETHVRWSARATRRTLAQGTLGFCDAYVDGDWSIEAGNLVDLTTTLLASGLSERMFPPRWADGRRAVAAMLARSSRARAHHAVRSHYDLGNDFYRLWLDDSMTYTCGYARRPSDSLEAMQQQKLELVCGKIRLEAGHTLLDLGCGWGSLSLLAAERGARVTAVNVSAPQLAFVRERASRRQLADRLTAAAVDYRDVTGTFDRVAAVGLAEHVGRRGLGPLFRTIHARLAADGVALVHTIASTTTGGTDPWIEQRIFPGSYVPAVPELLQHARESGLRVWNLEDIGPHYGLTLRHWLRRFLAARETVARMYDERFCRTWEMYLALLAPTFEHLPTCVVQMVLTRAGARAR